jgi:hypothetical protein
VKYCLEINKADPSKVPEKNPPWEGHYYRDFIMKSDGITKYAIDYLTAVNDGEFAIYITKLEEELRGRCSANCINYAPIVFLKLRQAYQIDEETLKNSLVPSSVFSNSESLSVLIESELFTTEDGLFTLKKINRNAKKHLIDKFLQNYHSHLSKHELETFLTPLMALYSFQLSASQNVSLLLWKNIVFNQPDNVLHTIFTFSNIEVKKESFIDSGDGKPSGCENFLIDKPPAEKFFRLKDKEKNKLLDTLGRDINFLITNGVQKYCVKIIFYKRNEKNKRSKIAFNKATSMPITREEVAPRLNKRKSNEEIDVVREVEEEEKYNNEIQKSHISYGINQRSQSENVKISEFPVSTKVPSNTDLYCTIEISNFEYSQEEDKKIKTKKAASGDRLSNSSGTFFSISNPDCYAKTLLDCVEKII